MLSPLITSTRCIFFLIILSIFAPASYADNLPAELSIQNGSLLLKLSTRDGTFSVLDKRNGKTWSQSAISADLIFSKAFIPPESSDKIDLEGIDARSKAPVKGEIALDGALPEFTVAIAGDGPLPKALTFPQPFVGGTDLIIPLNEGVRYPVNDLTIPEMSLVTYGGHGICMSFWGLTDGEAGQMAIL